jgi:protein-disulfide isomerase
MREFRRTGNILNARTVWGVGMKIVTFLLLSFSLLAQTNANSNAGPKSALDKATLEAYLRYSELWIPQVAVKIDDPKPSADLNNYFDVWVHLSYNGSTKDELYYVSKDGKNIVKGTAYDITKSPFQSTVAQLKTDQQPSFGAGAGAPVTLVVFGDFECPVCQKEEQELRKNLPASPLADKVRVYFTDFPLTSIHPWALKASITGRCMYHSNQSAFWDYHDWIYQNQGEINPQNLDAKVQEFAQQKGLDTMQLGRCLDDKNTAAEVERSMKQGHDLSVSATPTLFINGRKIEGALEWQVLSQLLQIEIDHQATLPKTTAKNDDQCCVVTIPSLGGK